MVKLSLWSDEEKWRRGCLTTLIMLKSVLDRSEWLASGSRPLYPRGARVVYRDVLGVLKKIEISRPYSDSNHDFLVLQFVVPLSLIQRYPRFAANYCTCSVSARVYSCCLKGKLQAFSLDDITSLLVWGYVVNNFDVLTPGGVFYGNVSLGDIIMHAINFYVVLTTVELEYINGYFWQWKCE